MFFLSKVAMSFLRLIFFLDTMFFFSGFAGALSSFGFSQVSSVHFLSIVGMSFLRLIFFLDVSRFFLWICWCSQQFWLLPGSQLMFFLSKVDMSSSF